ncbi:MAG: hypothetical protein ACE5PM_00625, partial [Candidatus Hydrothermarchaeales archaeon]
VRYVEIPTKDIDPNKCFECHKGGMQKGKEEKTLYCGKCHGSGKKRDVMAISAHISSHDDCFDCHV